MRILLAFALLGLCAGLSLTRRVAVSSTCAIASTCAVASVHAAAVPEGCVYTGEGEYKSVAEGRKSNEPKNLDCSEGFVKGFVGEELIFTPIVLAIAAFFKFRGDNA